MAEEARRQLAKAYVPAEFEHDIYERWLAADVFAPGRRRVNGGLDPRAVRASSSRRPTSPAASTSATPSAPPWRI